MATSGTVTINIVGDATRLKGALSEADSGLSGFSSKMDDIGHKLMGFGAKMTLGVTLPLALLGRAAFDAASDMNESMSKVEVVFGDNAAAIKEWSRSSAESMGISRQAALEAAGTFGNLFSALGVGAVPARDMSMSLVQLAADLASFNNLNPDDVLVKLRAGLVGEMEPLRSLGVALNADAVEMKAFEMRAEGVTGELTEGEKVAARYALIVEQTALAHGDFGRTAEGAANKQRILSAEFGNAKAKLGDALLPIFLQLAEAASKLAEWFGKLSPETQRLAVYAGLLLAAIGPLATIMGGLATIIGVLATPIIAIGLAIGILVGFAVLLYLKWDEVWEKVANNPWLLAILGPLGAILLPIIALVGIIKLLQENWDVIWPAIQRVAEEVWKVLQPVLDGGVKVIGAIKDAVVWLKERWDEAWPTIQSVLETAWDVMGKALDALLNVVGAIANVVVWLKERWDEAWPIISKAIEVAWGLMQPLLHALRDVVSGIVDVVGWIKDNAGAAWDGFKDGVSTMWGVVDGPLNALLSLLNGIVGAARSVKNAIESIPGVPGLPGNTGGIDLGPMIDANTPGAGWPTSGWGGRRASGGPVSAFGTYLVGENGPELLRMGNTGGNIIPNHALGGAGTTIGNVQIYIDGSGDPAAVAREVKANLMSIGAL
jgi:hypothetical protein